jgi:hypothetical protein
MKQKEKARAYDTQTLVEKFNKAYPVGSKVMLRKVSLNSYPYEEYVVKSKAIVSSATQPVASFEGISGWFSIEPDFIKY